VPGQRPELSVESAFRVSDDTPSTLGREATARALP